MECNSTLIYFDCSDLESFVPSDDGAGNSLRLLIQGLLSVEFWVWWNLWVFFSLLLLPCLSGYFSSSKKIWNTLCMMWSYARSSANNDRIVTNDSRLCLLLRARVAIGVKCIERMPYAELVRLYNSHAPLLDLDTSRKLSGSRRLCTIMKEASLHDLSYIYNATDIISRKVEQCLLLNSNYLKQQRLWERLSCKFDQECFDDYTIQRFQLVLMILSLFEGIDDIRNVILYGVPGLPSLSLPESATYSEIRSMIVREVPNFSEFYFVANGKVIEIEDNVIDWGFGHLVLNVHTSRDLPGGSKRLNSRRRGQRSKM